MKRALFNLYVASTTLFGILLGLLGALGLCVPIWGSRVLETAFGSPPDRSHPAFWLWLVLCLPAMLIGAVGALALFVLPVAFRFSAAARIAPRQNYQLRFLRWYADRILRFVATHDESAHDKNRIG